jgi:hypothetical protein
MLNHFSIWSAFLPGWMNDSPAFMVVKPIDRMQIAVGAILLFRKVVPKYTKAQRKVVARCCIALQTYF